MWVMPKLCPSSSYAKVLGLEYELWLDELVVLLSSEVLDEDELLDDEEGSSPPSGDWCIMCFDFRFDLFDRSFDFFCFPFLLLFEWYFLLVLGDALASFADGE
jgi:hypothetical protein